MSQRIWSIAAIIFSAGLLLILFIRPYIPLEIEKVFFFTLRFSLPPAVIFYLIAMTQTQNRKDLGDILLFTLCGFIMIGYSVFVIANGRFDTSQPIRVELPVIGKRFSISQRYGLGYRLELSPPADSPYKKGFITVPKKEYKKAIPQTSIISIEIKEGKFGFAWISRRELKQKIENDPSFTYTSWGKYQITRRTLEAARPKKEAEHFPLA